jgi:hypothetical protein
VIESIEVGTLGVEIRSGITDHPLTGGGDWICGTVAWDVVRGGTLSTSLVIEHDVQ